MGISDHKYNPRRRDTNSNIGPRSSSVAKSSASKPSYQKVGNNSLKKIKFHSKSCEDSSKQERIFLNLDPKNPKHAHKIQQRRKAITKGKNTIGYDIYCRSIPKDKRQKRSMITPSTPDHTLDISNKKWNGLVRSWRVALHSYDPVDLQHSFGAAQEAALAERHKVSQSSGVKDEEILTAKEKEIADSGLLNLVQVSTDFNNDFVHQDSLLRQRQLFSPRTRAVAESLNPTPLVSPDDAHGSRENGIISELNRWEAARQENEDASFFSREDDDSDDDLL